MHMNLPKDEILYDEIPFLTEFTINNVGRKSLITLNKYQLDHTHGNRHQPHRNNMNLTNNEYLEFLSTMAL